MAANCSRRLNSHKERDVSSSLLAEQSEAVKSAHFIFTTYQIIADIQEYGTLLTQPAVTNIFL